MSNCNLSKDNPIELGEVGQVFSQSNSKGMLIVIESTSTIVWQESHPTQRAVKFLSYDSDTKNSVGDTQQGFYLLEENEWGLATEKERANLRKRIKKVIEGQTDLLDCLV